MMRRKDREVTSRADIEAILQQCRVAHIAFQDEEAPYIVPMNFGYDWQGEAPVLYFHCAAEGKKLDLIKNCPKVGVEMDCGHQLVGEKKACSYGFLFQSITGWGVAELVETLEEKQHSLERLMFQQTGKEFSITPEETKTVTVFRIRLCSFSAKARKTF